MVAGIAIVVAAAGMVFALVAVFASRSAIAKATTAAMANREQVERANGAAQIARQEAAAAVKRLADVERKLIASELELKEALERAAQLDRRLADTEERLRQATVDITPPPIPSGRRAASLEGLRATLRAQAAEAADATDDERTP